MKIFSAIRKWFKWQGLSRRELLVALRASEDEVVLLVRENDRLAAEHRQVHQQNNRLFYELGRAREYLRGNHPNDSGQTIGLIHCCDPVVKENMDRTKRLLDAAGPL